MSGIRPYRWFAISSIALAFLGACDDDPSSSSSSQVVVATKPRAISSWLAQGDRQDPALWLRSREIGHEALPIDQDVGRLRKAISQARVRFYEDQRMIANRAAQTADALHEIGVQERYVDILTGLVDVADRSIGRTSFGAICQQYVTLRKSGKSRADALNYLADTYSHR
ncbi:hypothetical protein [Labrys sp. WJW]|uniref:hypothetical protein n=1 Tax=Labrys sp. WJW TaxID=1737983 RepID=UPI0012E9AE03|nr:hypothetical protein [Labrys sp. WJW]